MKRKVAFLLRFSIDTIRNSPMRHSHFFQIIFFVFRLKFWKTKWERSEKHKYVCYPWVKKMSKISVYENMKQSSQKLNVKNALVQHFLLNEGRKEKISVMCLLFLLYRQYLPLFYALCHEDVNAYVADIIM